MDAGDWALIASISASLGALAAFYAALLLALPDWPSAYVSRAAAWLCVAVEWHLWGRRRFDRELARRLKR